MTIRTTIDTTSSKALFKNQRIRKNANKPVKKGARNDRGKRGSR
jgi:hypothetical protein